MDRIKCQVRLHTNWKTWIPAEILAFVPGEKYRYRSPDDPSVGNVSTDVIVRLLSFDKDKLYQVPLDCVKIEE